MDRKKTRQKQKKTKQKLFGVKKCHLGVLELFELLHLVGPGVSDQLLRLGRVLFQGRDFGVLRNGRCVDGHLTHGRLLQVPLLPLRPLGLQSDDLENDFTIVFFQTLPRLGEGLHSTEVAYLLLSQQPQV